MTLHRRTPLQAKTRLRTDPAKIREWKRRTARPLRRRQSGMAKLAPEAVAVVLARAAGRCEVRAICEGDNGEHFHHRLMRSQGGKHTPENLLHVCSACHRYIHAHPFESYERGWLVKGNSVE